VTFWEISDNISETVQDRDIVAVYRISLLLVTFNGLKHHFCCLKPSYLTHLEK